ncbi:melanocyte-stimulating hormone receptor-like [Stylophora pistillata]|uniref:melanocyte-stimulating hormone receptor-like n=1 Tax=Stylophora pistillata TaxID=50429 RepID=UPI000C0514F0|nr:melanocyte-stimulating hormone receptor-like [Stylophora pistillata]XP_022787559.1 melanocyte-stimulating hormone receptor-like [Stylophora pistillata]
MPSGAGFYGSQVAKNSSQPEITVIVNCALNVPLMILSIFGNALVLVAILKTPSLRSSSILLLCSLAVSDLLVGTLIQPLYIASVLTRKELLDSLWFTVSFAACGISLCTITTISVDRFLALHFHMRYPSLVTKSRTVHAIAIIWFLIFLLSGVYYLNPLVYFFLIALGVGLFLLISIVAYIGIYRIVKRQKLQISTLQQAVQASTTENLSNFKQLKTSALNSFVFFIVMVVFYMPMSIAMTLYLVTENWDSAWGFATTAVFMNSSINPVLFCWRIGTLRKAVTKTVQKILGKQS